MHVSSPGVSPTLQSWHDFVKDLGNLSWNIDIGEDSSPSLRVCRRWGDWLQQTQMTQPQRKLFSTSGPTQCVPQMPSVRLSAEVLKGVPTTSPQGLHTTTPLPNQVHAPLLFRWITEKPYLKKEGKNKEIKKEKKFFRQKIGDKSHLILNTQICSKIADFFLFSFLLFFYTIFYFLFYCASKSLAF